MNNRSLRRVVSRLWRGQYGLAKTWWIFGVVGTLLLNAISGPLNAFAATSPWDGIEGVALLVAVVIVAAVGVIYGVVVTFGLVRSAMAYEGNRVWSWLAITLTACAWIFTLLYLVV
ncbi:MAG: hypothetical protein OXG05_07795 [Gammaproteobacteria bacterium]|nr:hypothetical protein [Gammaproteobacteria bacterium]